MLINNLVCTRAPFSDLKVLEIDELKGANYSAIPKTPLCPKTATHRAHLSLGEPVSLRQLW